MGSRVFLWSVLFCGNHSRAEAEIEALRLRSDGPNVRSRFRFSRAPRHPPTHDKRAVFACRLKRLEICVVLDRRSPDARSPLTMPGSAAWSCSWIGTSLLFEI